MRIMLNRFIQLEKNKYYHGIYKAFQLKKCTLNNHSEPCNYTVHLLS